MFFRVSFSPIRVDIHLMNFVSTEARYGSMFSKGDAQSRFGKPSWAIRIPKLLANSRLTPSVQFTVVPQLGTV